MPRTLSAEHWRRLDDGLLLARQPRVDWATLSRRCFVADLLCCPRCAGRMAVIEPVTEPHDIRRSLAALGLPSEPICFSPPRDPDEPCTRGPPPRAPSAADGAEPSFPDDFGDPAWQDDIPSLPDDAPQASPQGLSEVEGPDAAIRPPTVPRLRNHPAALLVTADDATFRTVLRNRATGRSGGELASDYLCSAGFALNELTLDSRRGAS